MIKSNGGVFGRNPTFNDVTVDGNLTVNGDIALGDDIVVADSLTVQGTAASTSTTTGALTVAGGVGIGGAVNIGGNAVINGVSVGAGPAGSGNTVVGNGSGTSIGAGTASSTYVGFQAGRINSGNHSVGIGRLALEQGGSDSVAIGSEAHTNAAGGHVVAIGRSALSANFSADTVAIGSNSLLRNTFGTQNVAIGRSALNTATTAVATVTQTVAGTGGSDGAKTNIQLERASGENMATFPIVNLTVTGGAVDAGSISIVNGGIGARGTTAGSIVFRANAAGIAAGVPADWRCQLQTVATAASNTAVGHQAGLSLTTGGDNTIFGALAGDALTTGIKNVAIGANALGAGTTGNNNVAIGFGSIRNGVTTGFANVCIGTGTGQAISSGQYNVVIGGVQDGSYSPTGDRLTTGLGNILIGRANLAANNNNNCIAIIPGANIQPVDGDGSNTTVIGSTATTQTRLFGGTFLSTGANGQSTQLGQSTTLLSGLTGATVTATNLIPANCILLGVTARVTTAITGATTFDIGTAGTPNLFGDDVAIALNTTVNTVQAPTVYAANTNVILTANTANFTGGAVRLTAHFMTLVAPTS